MQLDYASFIASKRLQTKQFGFTPVGKLNPFLFPWQEQIVQWALRRGRAALFEECGLGKTLQQLVWAVNVWDYTGKPVVIHTPVGVRQQTKEEAKKFQIQCRVEVVNKPSEIIDGINLINYEKLHLFDSSVWGGVVLDECFPKGTPIDTPNGPVNIECLRVGDSIINASGIDIVSDTHRREVKYAVAIQAGKRIVVSPNHPVFTRRGWLASQDLEPGDCILQTSKAMRMVQGDISTSAISVVWSDEVLREILLSEMADDSARAFSESSYEGNPRQNREEKIGLVQSGKPESIGVHREISQFESDARRRMSQESVCHLESHEAQTFRAWWKWQGADCPPENYDGCTWKRMEAGIYLVTGKTSSRLSNALQTRLSECRSKSLYRGGWKLSLFPQNARCEENGETGFVRVESLEILEQGNSELEKYRDAEGKLYFYDLGATRHPSYSVNGLLVHNSSVLKSFVGKTKRQLCEAYKDTRFKLACTATPAPNDHMELGNHSEFLGVMPSNEMLSRWFINDTMKAGGYRLRGHAKKDFWNWVATWAVCIAKPSDIGGSDEGYELPPLTVQRHFVEESDLPVKEGQLFGGMSVSATTLYEAKRSTSKFRALKVKELAESMEGPVLIWCDTNDEAEQLQKLLGYVEVRGSDSEDEKEKNLLGFSQGDPLRLITKPSLAGWGLNWQHCCNVIFAGMTFSFEQYYQAVRRCWRFGQTKPVQVHIIQARCDETIQSAISRKESDHQLMQSSMSEAMREATLAELHPELKRREYKADTRVEIPKWLKV